MVRTAGSGRRAAIASALLIAAQAAAASDGHTLQVSATILSKNTCRFTSAGPTALAFGSVDPAGGPIMIQASTTFRCTGSDPVATYTITSDDGLYANAPGQPRMRHATDATRYLPYTLSVPATGSVPKNTTQTFTITGTLGPADFADAPAGTYLDTIVLTLQP